MLNIDEAIDSFRRGAVDIDCKRMVLTQHKEGGERFEGQGYIRQSPDGTLVFKIYVSQCNAEPLGHLKARVGIKAGQLHCDEMFYDLDATAHDGTRWAAARILPAPNWDMSDRSVIVCGEMQSVIARLSQPPTRHYLRLHFFEEYQVPLHQMSETERHGNRCYVRDRTEFETCGAKFEVRKREGSGDTVVEVASDSALPVAFDLRIQEALQYITAKPAIWRARIESKDGGFNLELASPWRKSVHTQFSPPISSVSIHFHERGWELFGKYLAYAVEKTEGIHWNPVAYHLHNACEATANSVDAWAVGVSVAVEAVAGLINIEKDEEKEKAKSDRLVRFQERMRKLFAAETDFADLAPRMEGLINAMGNKRPQDTLYALADMGHVEKDYVDAWTYLRNRHVHPMLSDLKKPDTVDYQNLLDHIHRVEVLLRQLTFHLIGYEGPFTDYGVEGFPSKQYPLAKMCSSVDEEREI
ncbi:MAG: hypothetical protein KGJ79_03520 [Alphaproteobacteria bacterium]|nr:hypothetical protein [Alphaproteobacteria bacterium]MDE2492522.1 hypothetical protein [Alphaproteobacteria bacterium]